MNINYKLHRFFLYKNNHFKLKLGNIKNILLDFKVK